MFVLKHAAFSIENQFLITLHIVGIKILFQ